MLTIIAILFLAIMVIVLAICGFGFLATGLLGVLFSLGDVLLGGGIIYLIFFRHKKKNKEKKEAKKSE